MSSVFIALAASESSRYTSANATVANLERPHGSEVVPFISMSVPLNLNAAAEAFLASSHEWLFLVNDDQLYNPGTLVRLLAHQRPVVTGLTTLRTYPFVPAIYGPRDVGTGRPQPIYLKPGMRGLVPIHYCGDHSLLVHRRVLEAMPAPRWATRTDVWNSPDAVQHDVIFCDGVRAAGFEIVCDLDTPVGHLAVVPLVPQRDATGAWSTGLRLSNTHWYRVPAARADTVLA
jgi:hypothetical protein